MKRIVALGVAWLVCTSIAISAEPTADDYLNFFKPIVGNWTVKAKIGDKVEEGTFSCKLSPSKHCIVWYGSAITPYPAMQALDGYDPASKKWKSYSFTATGDHSITTLVVTAPESLKGKEATFRVEMIATSADGKTSKWQWKATFTMGKNEWKLAIVEQTKDGEKLPDEEYVYERKEKKQSNGPRR